MMSEILCVLFGIFLGVMWTFTVITPDKIETLSSVCKNNGGLEKSFVDIVSANAYCKDGAKFRLKD